MQIRAKCLRNEMSPQRNVRPTKCPCDEMTATKCPCDEVSAIRLEDCINDVCSWFTANKLMCNSTKSNFIYFSSKFKPSPTSISIKFGSSILQPVNNTEPVCYLG